MTTPDVVMMGSKDRNHPTPVIKANGALLGYSKTFTGSEIFSSSNKLTDEFTVTANQFKRKYTANDPINDPAKYKKKDLVEEDQMSCEFKP